MKDIIFFDGVCNLCDGFVHFVIDRDEAARFRFVSLQSEVAQQLLHQHGQLPPAVPATIYLLRAGKLYEQSEAVLLILQQLGSGWRYASGLRVLPRFIRDWAYRLVARHRYLILGRQVACRIPTPALRQRFL
ncbi:thiol-disulfide oxidoreductase DCC family protein [Hymenobacter psychrotolerans]|uniref:Predicted thiol-disulfide oxidoreductase YuxK, DCC family n=1 Tax=Hymenobacter psychrotolerans DSM 18569 TaxID=1121959 RepID=A0A1M6VES6_9BACT|nr:thiol-disulfide oxidoreductase DCC family protein [Hymenobacter psychrotolerans]SHK79948.1 Predicted thiol-disulfide oxidoreductase YuxK, DCC family [Hymenobacter psychrotolerans DSM 18569]